MCGLSDATKSLIFPIVQFVPRQTAQPIRSLSATVERHTWAGTREHCHQTSTCELGSTSYGVSAGFSVECHSAATSGRRSASERPFDALWPAQDGHPLLPLLRFATDVAHSCSGLFGHLHHTRRPDQAVTFEAVSAPLRVGCHWAASVGF